MMIDGRLLDTDSRWREYCKEFNIQDPFEEKWRTTPIIRTDDCWEFEFKTEKSPEELEWEERRDEYLRLMHNFRAWDCHFWMDWPRFENFFGNSSYTDISAYLPCDCADRQCSMWCAYFLGECPRQEGELKSPIKGLEGRYEI